MNIQQRISAAIQSLSAERDEMRERVKELEAERDMVLVRCKAMEGVVQAARDVTHNMAFYAGSSMNALHTALAKLDDAKVEDMKLFNCYESMAKTVRRARALVEREESEGRHMVILMGNQSLGQKNNKKDAAKVKDTSCPGDEEMVK